MSSRGNGSFWMALAFAALLITVGLLIWRNTPPAPHPQTTALTPTSPDLPPPTPPPELPRDTPAPGIRSPHLFLGNPSNATTDTRQRDNLLILKPICAISYNDAKGTPNWVSWRLVASDTGSAPRKPTFDPESTLPLGFDRILHKDYAGYGFDRGHMCPHSDRDANQVTSDATFVMSNIIPQAPAVNEKAWATLERYTRHLVTDRPMTAFIISGPFGKGGTGSKGYAETVGKGRVTVPSVCWKVIVVVPSAEAEDASTLSARRARVIAVRMPNDQTAVGMEWTPFRVTPASIESETGYHFFTDLRPEVAAELRNRLDTEDIPPAEPPNPRRTARRQKTPAAR